MRKIWCNRMWNVPCFCLDGSKAEGFCVRFSLIEDFGKYL